jgi:hypothetical protein
MVYKQKGPTNTRLPGALMLSQATALTGLLPIEYTGGSLVWNR